MAPNGWIKFFESGKQYLGYDKLVDKGKASWSKSSLEDIIKVDLIHDKYLLSLEGKGTFHQSDRYRCLFSTSQSELIGRTIQRLITPDDIAIHTYRAGSRILRIVVSPVDSIQGMEKAYIHQKLHGSWLVASIDLRKETPSLNFFFSENKV